jgi:hypothetical protein
MSNQDGFESWFDTYQRDGGELMLFNTLDLEAAWKAACELKGKEVAILRVDIAELERKNHE